MHIPPLQEIFHLKERDTVHSAIAGEANLDTNLGDVEVFFLPKTESFEEFNVIEQRSHGQYVYRFKGKPRARPGYRIETTGRDYYLKYGNALLLVSNTNLLVHLENALNLQPRTR